MHKCCYVAQSWNETKSQRMNFEIVGDSRSRPYTAMFLGFHGAQILICSSCRSAGESSIETAVVECRERYAALRPALTERSRVNPEFTPANTVPTKLEQHANYHAHTHTHAHTNCKHRLNGAHSHNKCCKNNTITAQHSTLTSPRLQFTVRDCCLCQLLVLCAHNSATFPIWT